MSSKASQTFSAMIAHVDQLIKIHGELQSGPGRRHQKESLHHAGVVMTIGAWENYVECVLNEAIDVLSQNLQAQSGGQSAPLWAQITFTVATQNAKNKIAQLHTPNAEKVRELFKQSIGFDPWPHWSWHVRRRQWNCLEMRNRLNAWLKIRHGIAHGAGLPQNITWIKDNNGNSRLTKKLLKECRNHINRLVNQTDLALRDFLINEHGIPQPW